MSKIFISYRRSDSQSITGRILDRLKEHFKTEEVFFDIETIPPGANFLDYTNEKLAGAEIFIPVIGKSWASSLKEREDDGNDFVRIEVEQALAKKLPIMPVLVEEAKMPKISEVPASITAITYQNSIAVRQSDFDSDINKLIEIIKSKVSKNALKPKPRAKGSWLDKLIYFGIGVVAIIGGLYYYYYSTKEVPCGKAQVGVLVANFQDKEHDGFANTIITKMNAELVDTVYDVHAVGYQPRDRNNYQEYVKQSFFEKSCTPAGLLINGFLSKEDQVFNLYTSFVNMEVKLPEYIKDNSLVLSNPSSIQFSIKEDAMYISEFHLAILQIHNGDFKEALKRLIELEKKDIKDKEVKANIAFLKGQCYALGGDEKKARAAFALAQNTENVSLSTAARTNESKAGSISKLYEATSTLDKMRNENINEYHKLEIEVLSTVGKDLLEDLNLIDKKDNKTKTKKKPTTEKKSKEKFRLKDLFK